MAQNKTALAGGHAYSMYRASGIHYADFLLAIGASPADVETLGRQWWDRLRVDILECDGHPPIEWLGTCKAERRGNVKPNSLTIPLASGTHQQFLQIPDKAAPLPGETITQRILRWREGQANADWESAERMRQIIEAELIKTWAYDTNLGAMVPTLSPDTIRKLTAALLDIQKIQRLALGMSSENVGMNVGATIGGRQLPVVNFIVEGKGNGCPDPSP